MGLLEILFIVVLALWLLFALAERSPTKFDLNPSNHGVFAFAAALLLGLKVFFGF